jgi:hypothetical protein
MANNCNRWFISTALATYHSPFLGLFYLAVADVAAVP